MALPLPHSSSPVRFADLKERVILVTGASSGIGAATARLLGAQGARVLLAARRVAACEALLDEIRSAGGEGLAMAADVARDEDMHGLVEAALTRWGRLDGAFNNAGVLGRGGPVAATADTDYDEVFDVNVRAAFHALRHQVPALRRGGGGALVFTASMAATVGFAQAAVYTASKHAVLGLVRSAALELGGEGIRVNALCPGVVDTAMSDVGFGSPAGRDAFVARTPAGRAGAPEEIAPAAAYLLSQASSFVNGQALLVDGGYTAV
ncbi:MAG: glucose 1-dehydrogenase [Proteobacteria bacterium]|nr:glucose 1-dehydrogenase [Pseudomonadota bacterium]